jgi:small subunit ribosomal protein S17
MNADATTGDTPTGAAAPAAARPNDKRNKTVTVQIERRTKHELYGKIVAKSSKYHAHDERGEYKMGDVVEIAESRPISKTKSWVVTRLVQKGVTV